MPEASSYSVFDELSDFVADYEYARGCRPQWIHLHPDALCLLLSHRAYRGVRFGVTPLFFWVAELVPDRQLAVDEVRMSHREN